MRCDLSGAISLVEPGCEIHIVVRHHFSLRAPRDYKKLDLATRLAAHSYIASYQILSSKAHLMPSLDL